MRACNTHRRTYSAVDDWETGFDLRTGLVANVGESTVQFLVDDSEFVYVHGLPYDMQEGANPF